jgi:uncharacterized cupredoxin-like copper-binding protein
VPRRRPAPALAVVAAGLAWIAGGCAGSPPQTPPPTPGTEAAPREVNVIARDYQFQPDPLDLVPGETILVHVVNGGLDVHELVIGDGAVQDAWEIAEAATVGHPPGPTPQVSVPPDVAGLRVVVGSGERVDVVYRVPSTAAEVESLVLGCHIPGHWGKGMRAAVRVAASAGEDGARSTGTDAAVSTGQPGPLPVVPFESSPEVGIGGHRATGSRRTIG